MSIRTQFREALQTALQAELEMPFEGGKIDGPQTDREIGCVWWEGKRPFGRDGNLEENYYRVRVLKRFMQDQGGETPRVDTALVLEDAAEALEAALRAVLARPWLEAAADVVLTNGQDYFNVTEVTADYERFLVETQLTASAQNRSARGG